MSDNVYKTVEITGTSSSGMDDAIANAVSTAAKTLRNLDWYQVVEVRGHIEEQQIIHTQVTLKIGFRLE